MPSSPMQSPSFGKKKSFTSSLNGHSAAAYLTALAEADSKSRKLNKGATPASTPALSFSSSLTTSSDSSSSYHEKSSRHGSAVKDQDGQVDDGTGLVIPLDPPTSAQSFTTVHSEFGHCANPAYRYMSRHSGDPASLHHAMEEPPYYILFTTYISYLWLICLGHLRDFFGKRLYPAKYSHLMASNGYAALNSDFDSFYTRRLKARMDDCFSHPVTGVPGRTINVLDRITSDYNDSYNYPGSITRSLNVSSYNYLGFAQARGGCADAVETAIKQFGLSSLGSRNEAGTLEMHVQAERLVARFVGAEDALIASMGFASNSTMIPTLVGKGCLVISDEFNHASIRVGVRLSGAQVRMFKHNDMKDLENLLREVISQGQPKSHRPWKKILIIVEGLYSMEGTMVDLPAVLELKKKYKFYLYVDEAHSIGALGPHGRGVCDYFGINPRQVDILMGTFTKSFGAAGGYVAGSKAVIDSIRTNTHGGSYAEAMSPVVLTQIIASMSSIMGIKSVVPAITAASSSPSHGHSHSSSSSSTIHASIDDEPYTGPVPSSLLPAWMPLTSYMRDGSEGTERLRRLAFNSRYLARGLKKLGFITFGHEDSPIVPLLLYNPGKMCAFHRLMCDPQRRQKHNGGSRSKESGIPIVVVVVGYPATPLVTSRVRFCLSASHIKSDVDALLRACDEVGDLLDLKHGQGERWGVDRIISDAVELVNA